MNDIANRSAVFIQLNQNHLLQNNMIVAKNIHATLSPTICDAVPNTKLYKNEDIPLSISASLAKQSSLPRTRIRKNNHINNIAKEYGPMNAGQHQHPTNTAANNSNSGNDDEIEYTHSNNSNNHHVHYSTMSANGRDYLRKTTGHLHRNINNNSTIASTNRYRWHNQSDEIALQSLRNNSMNIVANTTETEAITMQSNHRSHGSNRKQHHLNQINNNFIVPNKKQSIHNSNDDPRSIDQNNGNHYSSRLYH